MVFCGVAIGQQKSFDHSGVCRQGFSNATDIGLNGMCRDLLENLVFRLAGRPTIPAAATMHVCAYLGSEP